MYFTKKYLIDLYMGRYFVLEEKYFIINDRNKLYIIVKCTHQKLENYIDFGSKLVLRSNGTINLYRLAEWFVNHNIHFRFETKPTKNIITKFVTWLLTRKLNKYSIDSHMFIPDGDMEYMVCSLEKGNNDVCWDVNKSLL